MSGRLGLRKKKKERGKTGENHDSPLMLTQIVDSPLAAAVEELERDCTHIFTMGFEGPVAPQ